MYRHVFILIAILVFSYWLTYHWAEKKPMFKRRSSKPSKRSQREESIRILDDLLKQNKKSWARQIL